MSLRVVQVLTLCVILHGSDGLPGAAWIAGMFVDNAKDVGVTLPGYMNLLSSRSNFITNLIHHIWGDRLEQQFKKVIERDVQLMPETTPIEDVLDDNEEKMTFTNGYVTGLKSIEMNPLTQVEVIWNWFSLEAIVCVYFKELKIHGNIKTSFNAIRLLSYDVNGPAQIDILKNNIVLKFQFYPGIFEWCYLKLTDVFITDMNEFLWDVKNYKGNDDARAEALMQAYFANNEGAVEEHIKTAITNIIYHEVPKASPAICDNTNKYLRLSKYQTVKMKLDKKIKKTESKKQ